MYFVGHPIGGFQLWKRSRNAIVIILVEIFAIYLSTYIYKHLQIGMVQKGLFRMDSFLVPCNIMSFTNFFTNSSAFIFSLFSKIEKNIRVLQMLSYVLQSQISRIYFLSKTYNLCFG